MLIREMTDYFLVTEDEQYDVAWRRSDEVLSYFLKYEEEGSLEGYVPFNFGQVDKWLNLKVKGGRYTHHYSVTVFRDVVYVFVGTLQGTNYRTFDFYEFSTLADVQYFVVRTILNNAKNNKDIVVEDYVKVVHKNSQMYLTFKGGGK